MVTRRLLIVSLMSQVFASVRAWGEDRRPELVAIPSGEATLHAHVWRPAGRGPFPAILVNHGSGRTREQLERLGPYEGQSETLGPVFARHGYVCVFLFRRGVGPSTDQGESAVDAMDREGAAHGQSARNALQMELLEGRELADARAALAFVRRLFFLHAENDYSTNSGKSLDAELGKLGKRHRLKIYPPVGRTPDEGHDFPLNSVAAWEPDVFAFLDLCMRK